MSSFLCASGFSSGSPGISSGLKSVSRIERRILLVSRLTGLCRPPSGSETGSEFLGRWH